MPDKHTVFRFLVLTSLNGIIVSVVQVLVIKVKHNDNIMTSSGPTGLMLSWEVTDQILSAQ